MRMRPDTDSMREDETVILKAVPCEKCGTYTNRWGRQVVLTWTQNASGICRLHPIERGDLVDVDGGMLAEVILPADSAGNMILRGVQGQRFNAEISRVSL